MGFMNFKKPQCFLILSLMPTFSSLILQHLNCWNTYHTQSLRIIFQIKMLKCTHNKNANLCNSKVIFIINKIDKPQKFNIFC